jgi:hypothetical protein
MLQAPPAVAFDPTPLATDSSLVEGLRDRAHGVDPALHADAVRRVSAMYRAACLAQEAAPPQYQPGGEWADYNRERAWFYNALGSGDLSLAGTALASFWRNELGAIVKEYARFDQLTGPGRSEDRAELFTRSVLRNYLVWREIVGADPAELDIPLAGNPWGLMIEGRLVAPKATRFHTLAWRCRELLRGLDAPVMLEIGAGYAGAAYYLLRSSAGARQPAASPGLTWVDIDLPETLAIAAYSLIVSLPGRRIFLFGEGPIPSTRQELARYDAVLLPQFGLPTLADGSVDLLLNTFSFSEMPGPALAEYLAQASRLVRGYLLHNNMDRQGVVNRGFERTPASQYPLDVSRFKLLSKSFDLFHGHSGDYREWLYQRI